MALAAGIRLGPYEILSALGAGGMGEVYKARDTRLDRSVAIKVLPPDVSADPDRRARFEREAKTVAGLTHPHICTLHDIGDHDGSLFLVMEHLDGETLAHRLEKGPLPIEQTLTIATEIADALSAAHRHGITHRDLKPANVMLTRTGAKLLDFGIAKLRETAAFHQSDISTTAGSLTADGALVGTLKYMAPEQLQNGPCDARTDIFAFGAVLYEMLAGRRAFPGESTAEAIAAILQTEPPDFTIVSPDGRSFSTGNVRHVDRVVRKCLAKDPDRRWQSAADLTDELRWIAREDMRADTSEEAAQAATSVWTDRRVWRWTAIAGLLAAGALVALLTDNRDPASTIAAARFVVLPPAGQSVAIGPGAFSISPDGRRIALVLIGPGRDARLWLRDIDDVDAHALPGTEGAYSPFWSSDSRFVGFEALGKLKTVDISGGTSRTLADTAGGGMRYTWSKDGIILFQGRDRALNQVPARGGEVTPVTHLDPTRQEMQHLWPVFLPDGRRFLYYVASTIPENRGVFIASLDSPGQRHIAGISQGAICVPGYLLFSRDNTLMARPFDAGAAEFTGEEFPILERVELTPGMGANLPAYSASATGVLVYRPVPLEQGVSAWFNREGGRLSTVASEPYRWHRLSPDRTRIIAGRRDSRFRFDLFLLDLVRGGASRFTFDAEADESDPIWSPDGTSVVYSSSGEGWFTLFRKPAGGAADPEPLLKGRSAMYPTDWSPDGTSILLDLSGQNTATDIVLLPLTGDRKLLPIVHTPFKETNGRFSPDGRWFAYNSDESGTQQIYIQPFPPDGRRWQLSIDINGGTLPVWRRDGQELFYLAAASRVMAIDIAVSGNTLRAGVPRELFETRYREVADGFDVSADGKRILLPIEEGPSVPVEVILNWPTILTKRAR